MFDEKLREQFEVKHIGPTEDDPYGDIYEIYLRSEKVYEWDDNMIIDSAKNLIWLRDIQELFFDAVSIGLTLAMKIFKEQIEADNKNRQNRLQSMMDGLAKIDTLKMG